MSIHCSERTAKSAVRSSKTLGKMIVRKEVGFSDSEVWPTSLFAVKRMIVRLLLILQLFLLLCDPALAEELWKIEISEGKYSRTYLYNDSYSDALFALYEKESSSAEFLTSIKKSDGSKVWTIEDENLSLGYSPVVTQEDIITFSYVGYVTSRDKFTGEVNWKTKLEWNIMSEYSHGTKPVTYKETVLIVPTQKYIYAVDLKTGDIEWTFNYEDNMTRSESKSILFPGLSYALKQDILLVNFRKSLVAIEAQKGDHLWQKDFVSAGPVCENVLKHNSDVVCVGNELIYNIDALSGNLIPNEKTTLDDIGGRRWQTGNYSIRLNKSLREECELSGWKGHEIIWTRVLPKWPQIYEANDEYVFMKYFTSKWDSPYLSNAKAVFYFFWYNISPPHDVYLYLDTASGKTKKKIKSHSAFIEDKKLYYEHKNSIYCEDL